MSCEPARARFADLPQCAPHRFRYDNSVRYLRLAPLVRLETSSGEIVVDPPVRLVGWSDRLDAALMRDRDGQIALLFWHPEHEEVWEHYPLFVSDDRDAAVFRCVLEEPRRC